MYNRQSEESATDRITRVNAPWFTGWSGLVVILLAFVIAVINNSLEEPNMFIRMTLQPFIFVGMALLLYHIGIHVHAVHQNVILMAGNMSRETAD